MSPMKTKKKKIEIAVEGDLDPALRVGAVVQLIPVIGEGGVVVAYNVIDDADNMVVMTVPAAAVKASHEDDDAPYDGIVRRPSKPDYILPPLGSTLTDFDRALLVELYGERVVDDWHRRNAAFVARREGEGGDSGGGDSADDLTEDEKLELFRALVEAGLLTP
jgi:hypothetical protein